MGGRTSDYTGETLKRYAGDIRAMGQVRINFIYLAAGCARRFRANKLLTELDGKPLYLHGLERLCSLKETVERQIPGGRVTSVNVQPLVVTAWDAVSEYCTAKGIAHVRNDFPGNTGMASSIQTGIRACEESAFTEHSRAEAVRAEYDMFFTADQPWLDVTFLAAFLFAFLGQSRSIGAPCWKDVPRSPGIFSTAWRQEFFELSADEGGKCIRKAHPADVFLYPAEAPDMFYDIDTPEDLISAGMRSKQK